MLNNITKYNIPDYVHFKSATINMADMGSRNIVIDINIDGNITPDFSAEWEIGYKGERYIHPIHKPQAGKDNTSYNSYATLTFYHYAEYQLKRYFFIEMTSTETGTAIVDKYEASLVLNLYDFVEAFKKVLDYYYGDKIKIELNPQWQADKTPTSISITYSYIWDILQKLYELFNVRWEIVHSDNSYIIKLGYPKSDITHIFEYGFEGGLLKTERQVQSPDIKNVLLGRGGEANLPYRYFKDLDKENPTFLADPDWIPELKNIYFANLRGKTFRDYVKGWKTNPNRQLLDTDGNQIVDSNGDAIKIEQYDAEYALNNKSYERGHTDSKFAPIEYVKADGYQKNIGYIAEDDSISEYGELWGNLDNNEDIYPTIQNVVIPGYGRIDEIVDVEQVTSDDVTAAIKDDTIEISFADGLKTTKVRYAETPGILKEVDAEVESLSFEVKAGKTVNVIANLEFKVLEQFFITSLGTKDRTNESAIIDSEIVAYNYATQEEIPPVNLLEGKYKIIGRAKINAYHSEGMGYLYVILNLTHIKLTERTIGNDGKNWGGTFNVWIKNVWQTKKLDGESDNDYANRIWIPILGNKLGEEAKVVFSSGMLSTSEDYEFTIVDIPTFDDSKVVTSSDGETYQSHWKLTLAKSDADLDSIGLYVPSTMRQGSAGDTFFFIGIDLPHLYVLWAEQRLDEYKIEELDKVKDIKPTWVVQLDKVRLGNMKDSEQTDSVSLLEKLDVGMQIKLKDKRFIPTLETLYLQSITYKYTNNNANKVSLTPDVEVVLSNDVLAASSPVALMQGEIVTLNRQVGSLSNIEQTIRIIGDKLYLRKDGISDTSFSPTVFVSKVSSEDFRQGQVGGKGWATYRDDAGNTILEIDKIFLRKELHTSNLVINQISVMGGKEISSAASFQLTMVEQIGEDYKCFFDQRQGSVSNLFMIDDIAYSQRFDEDNKQIKFYKRKVIAVGDNFITLSGSIANGDGIPTENDVVCHYGNYTDLDRQYVKIRDVIGGGYERYLEGLDSVNSEGKEYYFVGTQIGESPRFFIGDKEAQYLEFKNGVLTIKGTLTVDSKIGNETLSNYTSGNLRGENYAIGTWNAIKDKARKRSLYTVKGLTRSNTITISFDIIISNFMFIPQQGYVQLIFGEGYGRLVASDKFTTSGHYSKTIILPSKVNSSTESTIDLEIQGAASNEKSYYIISNLKVEVGSVETPWTYSKYDSPLVKTQVDSYNYLKDALVEDTTIDGGLIQTTLVKLGYQGKDGYVVMSGINGKPKQEALGKGLAFWAGGKPVDRQLDSTNGAMFGIRMDGTAYASGNVIKFNDDNISIGDTFIMDDSRIIGIDESGNTIIELSREKVLSGAIILEGTAEKYTDNIIFDSIPIEYSNYGFNLTKILLDRVYEVKEFKREASVQIDITCNFNFGTSIPPLSALVNMIVELDYLNPNNTIAYSHIMTAKSIIDNMVNFAHSYNVAIPEQKGHKIRLTLKSINPVSTDLIATSFSIDGFVKFTGKNYYEDKTLIGKDGIQAVHNNGYFVKNKYEQITLIGNFGQKIDSTGIYLTDNGGITWNKQTINKSQV